MSTVIGISLCCLTVLAVFGIAAWCSGMNRGSLDNSAPEHRV